MPRNTRRIGIRFTTFSRATPSGYGQASIRIYNIPKGRARVRYAGIRLDKPLQVKMFGLVPAALNPPATVRKST